MAIDPRELEIAARIVLEEITNEFGWPSSDIPDDSPVGPDSECLMTWGSVRRLSAALGE